MASVAATSSNSSTHSSPARTFAPAESTENEPILIFSICTGDEHKLQPLTEEEVLKMNSMGQDIAANGDSLLVDTADSCNLENTIDKSSVANGYDAMDGMSDVLRSSHNKNSRFSLSHDDASIGNSDNLEVVSEAPSNHSVTSSLELEENDQNDNLSDMVSANVSGRGTPNISGRDTPSSQVTDGESVHNAMPTPQMQKLLSKARSDIEDKFCKFELKKFEGDETVSIISDTWSTDVLASDSENLEANERERDRNFSTPLIPSAVVLPGDNNFDVLGVSGVGRSGYLDASDQRSESNWSTDVLASDSEKLAEIDTDDNLSITTKSDITDARRIERERDILAAAISAPPARRSNRSNNSSAAAAVGGVIAGGDGDDHGSGGSSNGSVSDRSQEDSAFFDAINLYDEAAAAVAGSHNGEELTSAASLHHYHGLSSLARSSVRTTNQYNGENSFQQNYKSSYNDSKEAFLSTPRMRRQTSAESSISNQSFNEEGAASLPPKAHHHHHKAAIKKKNRNSIQNSKSEKSKDLIDFSDFGEEERATSTSTAAQHNAILDLFASDDAGSTVEHRSMSNEQRNVGIDGRRNGIMAFKPGSNAIPSLRRHQSLNYENHEILVNTNIPKRMSAMPCLKQTNNEHAGTSQTDDDKQQLAEQAEELLLCAKTAQLNLNDAPTDNSADIFDSSTAALNSTRNSSTSGSNLQQKPKNTGAIPKSISFDASADKNSNHNLNAAHSSTSRAYNRSSRNVHLATGATSMTPNSGIFNKLKHGFFKNRKTSKSHRHNSSAATSAAVASGVAGLVDSDFPISSRSVSFSTTSAEVSIDLFSNNRSTTAAAYGDISEDILAKYRRKVSTSSEATNSDSTGCNGMLAASGIGLRSDLDAK